MILYGFAWLTRTRENSTKLMTLSELSSDLISSSDPLSSLTFSIPIPQITQHFALAALAAESRPQPIAIIRRLSRYSVDVSKANVETPDLLSPIVTASLLTPIPLPLDSGSLPDSNAMRCLHCLALSSRENALKLVGLAGALLCFVTTFIPPSNSPFSPILAEVLLCDTLDVYASLSAYSIYAGVATTASEHFSRLSDHNISGANRLEKLATSWLRLIDVWMTAARDPHCTTPQHDLL